MAKKLSDLDRVLLAIDGLGDKIVAAVKERREEGDKELVYKIQLVLKGVANLNSNLNTLGGSLMSGMDDIRKEARETKDAITAIRKVLKRISQRLRDLIAAGNNDPELTALAAELDSEQKGIAEDILANTDVDPGEEDDDEEEEPTPGGEEPPPPGSAEAGNKGLGTSTEGKG